MSVLFAALHPERVAALILYGSLPRFLWAPDFPWGQVREEWDREIEHDARGWGTVELAREWVPGVPDEEAESLARGMRMGGSPNARRQIERMNQEIDVRHVLPSIAVPTLVLHRTEDHLPVEGARWMAGQIPAATFVELPGGPISRRSATGKRSSTRFTPFSAGFGSAASGKSPSGTGC